MWDGVTRQEFDPPRVTPPKRAANVQPPNALPIYEVAEIGNKESSVERCLNSFDEAPRVSGSLPRLSQCTHRYCIQCPTLSSSCSTAHTTGHSLIPVNVVRYFTSCLCPFRLLPHCESLILQILLSEPLGRQQSSSHSPQRSRRLQFPQTPPKRPRMYDRLCIYPSQLCKPCITFLRVVPNA